ncbi:hypothetical protein [Paenibacillus woosongensis]|uniref:Aldose 1-epimerase n=1 Tax=Paenibacillus woosongensis TaxID=307580 RepID=A0A7X3CMF2_9BACL|nr:hypothetical protein [Paenibacillus woosongensis]MUG43875.1 hypothetical protein [Paenibacillus woosongensis]
MGFQLSNEHLIVDIAAVGDYKGTRFDWSGFITGITMREGNHSFCVPESLKSGEGTGGSGLCNEFSLKEAIGYEDATVGGQFPKLGVGLLTRTDAAPYQFYRNYPLQPYRIDAEIRNEQNIVFTVHPMSCGGYAAQLEKSISLDRNRLRIEYQLTNTGTREIRTEEYNHNFLGIDGQPIGPDYDLQFPFAIEAWTDEPGTMDGLRIDGGAVAWERVPDKPFYFHIGGYSTCASPWLWNLKHRPSGAGVREISSFPVYSAAVWGMGHVVSPEMFIRIELQPGESQKWSRIYEFYREP